MSLFSPTASCSLKRNQFFGWAIVLAACAAASAAAVIEPAQVSTQKVEVSTQKVETAAAAATSAEDLAQKWGIQVSGLFISAGGNMVDFRYKVLDPKKAAILTKPESKPRLIDQTSGAKLLVPDTPTVGQLRQTTQQPVAGKLYFILFANTQHHVKSGDKVTISVGDFLAEGLTVE